MRTCISQERKRKRHWREGEGNMSRIYISGAITGTSDFRERFLKAEKKLIECGWETVNPARLNDIMPKDATYNEYMKMSFELLSMCDTIYMLKGWEESKGANREYGFAVARGIKILMEESA
jgi:hypothetical protein